MVRYSLFMTLIVVVMLLTTADCTGAVKASCDGCDGCTSQATVMGNICESKACGILPLIKRKEISEPVVVKRTRRMWRSGRRGIFRLSSRLRHRLSARGCCH